MNQFLAQALDFVFETAAQLVQGHVVCPGALAGDQVGYGFCLTEVEFAVQEGAQGKLPGRGHARAMREGRLNDFLQNIGRAVATEFHAVFAGVGVRIFENGGQALIEVAALRRYNTSEMHGMAGCIFQAFAFEHDIGNKQGAGAGKAYYTNSAHTRRGG